MRRFHRNQISDWRFASLRCAGRTRGHDPPRHMFLKLCSFKCGLQARGLVGRRNGSDQNSGRAECEPFMDQHGPKGNRISHQDCFGSKPWERGLCFAIGAAHAGVWGRIVAEGHFLVLRFLVRMHWAHRTTATIGRRKHDSCKCRKRACQQRSQQQQCAQPFHNANA
jgi:hypothetical protein